jgi:hypothetical protein
MQSIIMLLSEQRIFAKNVLIPGISTEGKLLDIPDIEVRQKYIEKCNLENPESSNRLSGYATFY